jgi:hypothetical protein
VYDPAKREEWESGGFRIANEFGFVYTRPNLEEVILGYTFQFSDTLSKNAMDTALSSDFMFKALLTEDETGTVESMPITRPIGDHAFAFTFISPENPEGVRIDCFFFRQGHVGAAIYHAYPRGVWKITLEQMAQILDAKFKALASP